MAESNVWKLQDAKARFSEVVRRAREGVPQRVTVRGKEAVVIIDSERFEVTPKAPPPRTLAEFIESSKKYRGVTEGMDFESPFRVVFPGRRGSISRKRKT